MSQASFQVTYDGPALENHEFDVRELAPALLALGDLFEEANHEINGSGTKVQLNVKGSFRSGSFGIDFTLVQNIVTQTVSIFSGNETTAALNLIQSLGLVREGSVGLVRVLKWIRGRNIDRVIVFDDGRARIEIDKDALETEEEVIKLLRNLRVRKALQDVIVKPLSKEGITSFSTSINKDVMEITDVELDYFNAPVEDDELLSDDIVEANLQAIGVMFTEGNKWRFTDGNASFFASVLDESFIHSVQTNQISFTKDDLIHVEMRRKQRLTSAGIRTEYEITKVLHHRSAAKQLSLPMEEGKYLDGDTNNRLDKEILHPSQED